VERAAVLGATESCQVPRPAAQLDLGRALMRRAFAIEILVCERCGGARRILGAVTEPL
jgi:hypothetical protein